MQRRLIELLKVFALGLLFASPLWLDFFIRRFG